MWMEFLLHMDNRAREDISGLLLVPGVRVIKQLLSAHAQPAMLLPAFPLGRNRLLLWEWDSYSSRECLLPTGSTLGWQRVWTHKHLLQLQSATMVLQAAVRSNQSEYWGSADDGCVSPLTWTRRRSNWVNWVVHPVEQQLAIELASTMHTLIMTQFYFGFFF